MSSKEITRNPRTADAIEPWTIGAARTGESREVLRQRKSETLQDRLKKGELQQLSLFTDENGIIRVGGRVDKALSLL